MIQSTIQNYELYEFLKDANLCVKHVFDIRPDLKRAGTYRQINEELVRLGITKYNNDKGLLTLDRASRKVRRFEEKNMLQAEDYRQFYGRYI